MTITGTNFVAPATVPRGTAATSVVVVSSTSITATTPAHAAGLVNVVVTSNGVSGTLANGFNYSTPVPISFVQAVGQTTQPTQAIVALTYPAAQVAGHLNIVVVGWVGTTTTVSSVVDNRGNVYQLAIGPTTGTGLRQSIYYASNIGGGATTVTTTFSAAVVSDVRILEYAGVTTLDVTAAATGTGTATNSGTATTTAANELIFGADTV